MRKIRVVEIVWEDSWSNENDRYYESELMLEPPLLLTNIGYLVAENSHGVVISSALPTPSGGWTHVHNIPKRMIHKRRDLK